MNQKKIGSIEEIFDNTITVRLETDLSSLPNLMGYHLIFEDGNSKVVGEVTYLSKTMLKAIVVGRIVNRIFYADTMLKPSLNSMVRIIELPELELILGAQSVNQGFTSFGISNVYPGYRINIEIDKLFAHHTAIAGNSGSGKSCVVASLLQKLYLSGPNPPLNSNLFFFDTYGEYINVFSRLHEANSHIHYKVFHTDLKNINDELFRIPIWLLDVDDLALLLDAKDPYQLQVIEKMLKLMPILINQDEVSIRKKNDIIARALQDVLLSGHDSTTAHDQILALLMKFHTDSLHLDSQIVQPGYTRTLRQCLSINASGKISDITAVLNFIREFILDDNEVLPDFLSSPIYSIDDLEQALNLTLISEGVMNNKRAYELANSLVVRLRALVSHEYRNYFTYDQYLNREDYIDWLLTDSSGQKCQIVNVNIHDMNDRLAKVFTKIISRLLFLNATSAKNRGEKPYHIVIEEAHRYVQHDLDVELLGYNIFERIIKEGRKYGVLLMLITQRLHELGDTIISQCSNIVVLKTFHPLDVHFIQEMIPGSTEKISNQLKNLGVGDCIAFGSAFKLPLAMHVDLPNPMPMSNNIELSKVWYHSNQEGVSSQPVESLGDMNVQ